MAKRKISPATVVTLHFDDNRIARTLFGPEDSYLRALEKSMGVEISARYDLQASPTGFLNQMASVRVSMRY